PTPADSELLFPSPSPSSLTIPLTKAASQIVTSRCVCHWDPSKLVNLGLVGRGEAGSLSLVPYSISKTLMLPAPFLWGFVYSTLGASGNFILSCPCRFLLQEMGVEGNSCLDDAPG
ncbi:hypothetical protein H1C71_024335, partial [Ictidomys tridecemlineatus]